MESGKQQTAEKTQTPRIGAIPLKLEKKRDGLLYVPAGYRPGRRAPLVLMLHGAGGDAQQGLRILQGLANQSGFLLLATDSRGRTWDIILAPAILFQVMP